MYKTTFFRIVDKNVWAAGFVSACFQIVVKNVWAGKSETAWPIKVKSHMEPPRDGATKCCSNDPGHMTKMAAMPIYMVNTLKIFFSRTKGPMTLKLGMQHQVHKYYQACSNDDPGLTMTYLRSLMILYEKKR